ncbi:MAG: hypothetical protein L6Q99_04565 [Planctomycetes bacterium]|nr:hypothetical protein [Planctomycetota bacterium]
MSPFRKAFWRALFLGACLASASPAQVVVVGTGAVYADLPEAVAAAPDGGSLIVGPGTYSGFGLYGKSLSIFALPGSTVVIDGGVEVGSLAATQSVVLSGLEVTAGLSTAETTPALRVSDCLGDVRVQDCTLTGRVITDCDNGGGDGASVRNSTRVVFVACQLNGGHANTSCGCIGGGNGGNGLFAESSDVALYDSKFHGGSGSWGQWYGGSGGSGAITVDSDLFASGSIFEHGFAAPSCSSGGVSGFNGIGLLLLDATSQARLLGCGATSLGGPGQFAIKSIQARSFSTTSAVTIERASSTLTVEGVPGDRVFLASSFTSGYVPLSSYFGVWLVPYPSYVTKQPLGVVPPSGVLTVPITSFEVPSGAARVMHRQGLVLAANGAWLASPIHQLVLDRQSGPDCDSNGSADLVDQLEGAPDCNSNFVLDACDITLGTSADCNANAVPDECDISTGSSTDCDSNGVPDECEAFVDCNANGTLDACDIQSGASADANHNGVPDECEPGTSTLWVDASAPPGGDGSVAHPFQTIGDAVAVARSGYTIVVKDGIYSGPANRELDFDGRNLHLRSENGFANCVIDCQGLGRAIYLHSGEVSARIEGFTIRNGVANTVAGGVQRGGGVLWWGGLGSLVDCRFENCSSGRFGGAVSLLPKAGSPARIERCSFVACGTPTTSDTLYVGGAIAVGDPLVTSVIANVGIARCTFAGCTSGRGGALFDRMSRVDLTHSEFRANSARRGGAVYHGGGQPLVVDQCLFAGNVALTAGGRGGALASEDDYGFPCVVELHSSTFAANTSNGQGGTLWLENHSANTLADSILWGGTSLVGQGHEIALFADYAVGTRLDVAYSDVAGGQAGVWRNSTTFTTLNWNAGNLDVDPKFVDFDGPDDDPLTFGDNVYRLQSTSPCLDAGDNGGVGFDVHDVDGDGSTTEATPLDLNLKPRFTDLPAVPDTGVGTPPIVDLGCYERQG